MVATPISLLLPRQMGCMACTFAVKLVKYFGNFRLFRYLCTLKFVNEILDLNPYDENVYISMMECYVMKDDPENAMESLERGLRILPNNAALLYRKAFLYFAQDKEESGLLTLEMALKSDYDGHIEFLNFDAENLTSNPNIMDLIEEYRIKNRK